MTRIVWVIDLLFVWSCLSAAGTQPDVRFVEVVSAARQVANLPADADEQARRAALDKLDRLSPPLDKPLGPVCAYVRCLALQRAGNSAEAQRGYARLVSFASVAPEAVQGLREANPMPPARRIPFEQCLADLLHISMWRTQQDVGRSAPYCDVDDPPPPVIPFSDSRRLVGIAVLFESAGLRDYAWRAYVEAIYGGRAPSRSNHAQKREARLSPDTAGLWASAAKNAWRSGEHAIAYDYLAKSVIVGPDAQLDAARMSLAAWVAGTGEAQAPIPNEQLHAAVEEIVTLYAEMNVHPRALEILRAHPEWVKDADALAARIAQDWKAVLKLYNRCLKRVVVFGVEVTDQTDPTRIPVPFACSPEALQRVGQEIPRLLNVEPAP